MNLFYSVVSRKYSPTANSNSFSQEDGLNEKGEQVGSIDRKAEEIINRYKISGDRKFVDALIALGCGDEEFDKIFGIYSGEIKIGNHTIEKMEKVKQREPEGGGWENGMYFCTFYDKGKKITYMVVGYEGINWYVIKHSNYSNRR